MNGVEGRSEKEMGNGGGGLVLSLQKILHVSWNTAPLPCLRKQRFSD